LVVLFSHAKGALLSKAGIRGINSSHDSGVAGIGSWHLCHTNADFWVAAALHRLTKKADQLIRFAPYGMDLQ
jgi:hypothetical protein